MRFWAWLLTAYYGWEQNQYFGWHAFPRTDAELMVDGINALLIMGGLLLTVYERSKVAASGNIEPGGGK